MHSQGYNAYMYIQIIPLDKHRGFNDNRTTVTQSPQIIAIEEDSTLDISIHLTEMYSNSGATR